MSVCPGRYPEVRRNPYPSGSTSRMPVRRLFSPSTPRLPTISWSSETFFASSSDFSIVRAYATSGSLLSLQFFLQLLPVLVEGRQSLVGERVLHQLREHVVRHRRDVGAGERRVDHVHRVPKRRGEHVRLVPLDLVDRADLPQRV